MTDITHDIPDEGFHEIQLSGKQLVFLFMATTVVSVVIFLCGVLVGRDVQTAQPVAAAAALTTPAPAPAPVAEEASAQAARGPAEPPSPPAEDELTYRKRLESEGSTAESLKPPAAAPRAEAKAEPARPEPARSTPAGQGGGGKHGQRGAGCGRPARPVGRPARRAARPRGRLLHRAAAVREGIPGVHREPIAIHAESGLQGAGRALRRSRRGRAGVAASREGREVPALDFALALLSGVLLALSFPKFGTPACAWLALTPLLVALARDGGAPRPYRRAFFLGLSTGGVCFALPCTGSSRP